MRKSKKQLRVVDKIHAFRTKEKSIFTHKLNAFLTANQKSLEYLDFFVEIQKFIAQADSEMISRANILVDEINDVQERDKEIASDGLSKLLDRFVTEIRDYIFESCGKSVISFAPKNVKAFVEIKFPNRA